MVQVYIDMNVVTRANGGADALKCTLYVNTAAHALAREFQMLMFSRQSMMVSANGPNEAQEFPLHQPDEAVALEVKVLLAWLACVVEHKQAGLLVP